MWVDPNTADVYAPLPDYATKQKQLEQRKALAKAKMVQAMQAQMPQGEMVGNRYVAPHWTQQFNAAIAAPLAAAVEQGMVDRDETELGKTIKAAAEKHMAEMPRGETQVTPLLDDAGNPVTNQLPATREDKIKWAQRGVAIPTLRDTLAKVVDDQLINEPVREEQRQFRSSEAQANRDAALQSKREQLAARMDELRMRLEDRNADRASREQAAAEMRALQREIAQMNADTRRDVAQINAAARGNSAERPVPTGIVKELGALEDKAATFGRLSDTFKPEFAGPRAAIEVAAGSYLPGGSKTADWWKDYRRNMELIERHELFGAALTAQEQQKWTQATISPAMDSTTIARNLKTQSELAGRMFERARERYGNAGYNVGRAFGPRQTKSTSVPGTPGQGATGPNGQVVDFGSLR